jgi:hypothetical protein
VLASKPAEQEQTSWERGTPASHRGQRGGVDGGAELAPVALQQLDEDVNLGAGREGGDGRGFEGLADGNLHLGGAPSSLWFGGPSQRR